MPTEEELVSAAMKAFALYVEGNILDQIVFEEVYNTLLEGVTGATREEIIEIALNESARLIENINIGTQEGIAEMIADALENQIGVDGLQKELQEKIGLNAQQVRQAHKLEEELIAKGYTNEQIAEEMEKFTEQKTKERAKVIANTEMRAAMQKGEAEVMIARGAKYKVAISSQDRKVSDICQKNEAKGPISIDEDFPSGHSLPPFHPDCRCTVTFITSEEGKARSEELTDKRKNRTAEAKEEE